MALTVEDGTGLAAADSYISTSAADAYFADRSEPDWAVNTVTKEAALRYAARWIDGRYTFRGGVLNYTAPQALKWPRVGAYDDEGRTIAAVPTELKHAQCEAAVAHLAEALNEVRKRGGAVESVRVGPISKTYSTSAAAGRTFPYIDSLMAPLIVGGPGSVRLVR